MLNFFEINGQQRFVDLPGYGYAKVPLDIKNEWHQLMEIYLTQRKSLCAIVLVMDVRHPLTDFDWQMVEWSEHSALPLAFIVNQSR